ncbi:MAG: hypothetical protein ABIH55_04740 [Nanoarchaeota archaeon]
MVQIRKIDEKRVDKMIREVVARAEGLRSFQDEKQAVIDQFKKEHQRCRNGQISERALEASSKRRMKELMSLDSKIRNDIKRARSSMRSTNKYIDVYLPEKVKTSKSGVHRVSLKKKSRSAAKKTTAIRKVARRPARTTKARTTKRRSTKARSVKRKK